jgi:hypothetical protein
LFLYLDKAIYVPDENILFTAYLLDKGGDTTTPHALYVLLVDLARKKVVASDRFIMTEGISTGSLSIPDTLESGQYLLMAYTNVMLGSDKKSLFRQQISIRSSKKAAFDLAVASLPDPPRGHDSIRLRCRITTDYGGLATRGTFEYSLMGDGTVLKSGKAIIDAFGEINIDLPGKDTLVKSVVLYSEVSRDSKFARFWTPLSLTPRQAAITYYPEGGHLVDGHPSRIGIEVRSKGGMGIKTNGILREDGVEVSRFSTDEYGLGVVDCTPRAGKKYDVRLEDLPRGMYACGQFPEILHEGFTLQVDNGIPRDSLILRIRAPYSDSKCSLMIYSDHAVLYTARLALHGDSGRLVIPVSDWPSGMAEVTLFTENGAPLAERAIFLPFPKITVDVKPDSLTYHVRSKVELHIKVTDGQDKSVAGLFSFASVLSSRVHSASDPNIILNLNADRFLPMDHPPLPPAGYFDYDSSIDVLLLTRFWTVNHWAEIMGDTLLNEKRGMQTEDFGYVLVKNKKSQIPIPLTLIGHSVYRITTDSSGTYKIPFKALIEPFGINPVLCAIDKKHQDNYGIVVQNTYDTLNQQLAASWYAPRQLTKDTNIPEEEKDDPQFNSVKTLQNVVIRVGRNAVDTYEGECSDYICMYGFLNCPNHSWGRKPRNGELVIVPNFPNGVLKKILPHQGAQIGIDEVIGGGRETFDSLGFGTGVFFGIREVVYNGTCADNSIFAGAVQGIHQPKEWYKTDSAGAPPPDSAILSTLYWSPVTITDKNGEAVVSFYTNDLKGRFFINVQGISTKGAFSGREVFSVE